MKPKIILILIAMLFAFSYVFAEVPMHNPDLDKNCPSGFQWSRDTASCKQADCPAGAGRTYTDDCNCGEAWSRPFRTCYDSKTPGLATSCVAAGQKCPGEKSTTQAPTQKDQNYAASIVSFSGDVEYSSDGGVTFAPLTQDVKLKKGDYISTGFDSRATMDFGYAKLDVYQLTQFRIDDFTSEQNINKTQLYLRIGAVQPRNLSHTAAIRSDFSVVTPTAISSIRGSAMKVEYDNQTSQTRVTVIEDEAFVKGNNDQNEMTLSQGEVALISSDGRAKLRPGDRVEPSAPPCCASLIVPSAIIGILLLRKKY
ncbi:hypothetical protein HY990_02285 [Candidatus Micrarchaeota archaeon]|nr:hypothetical protein [Candidatus Micrarchaeota archaeon]